MPSTSSKHWLLATFVAKMPEDFSETGQQRPPEGPGKDQAADDP
jgi:hypothetical protein